MLPRWIKQNPLLTAAFGLPFLLILFFGTTAAVTHLNIAPPAYDFILLSGTPYYPEAKITYQEKQATLTRPCLNDPHTIRAYRFRHHTQTLEPYDIPLPACTGTTPVTLTIPTPEGYHFTPKDTAPDGYRFMREESYRSYGSLTSFFFGEPRRARDLALRLHKRIVHIPAPDEDPGVTYYSTLFIGWLIYGPEPTTH